MHRSAGLERTRRWATGLLASLVVLVACGGPPAAAASLQSGGTQTFAVQQLVQQYLSVLGPADTKFSRVEGALKALGPSATRTQVLAAAAPLGPVLAPIEALLAAPPPTTLEALGQPQSLGYEAKYRTTGEGAHLDIGGKLYPNGFQVDSGTFAMLNWPTRDRYTIFVSPNWHGRSQHEQEPGGECFI